MKKILMLGFLQLMCLGVKGQELMMIGEHYRIPEFYGNVFDSDYVEYPAKGVKIMLQKSYNKVTGDSIKVVRFQDKLMLRYAGYLDWDELDAIIKGIDYIRFNKLFQKMPNNNRSIIYSKNGMAFGLWYSKTKPTEWNTFIIFDFRYPESLVYLSHDDFSNISEHLKKILKSH
jgi:hypothetical protein